MAILDLDSDVLPFLGVATTHRDLVEMYRRTIEAAACRFVGHGIEQTTYANEYYPRDDLRTVGHGNGIYVNVRGENVAVGDTVSSIVVSGDRLRLDNPFVRSITEVREDINGVFGTGSGFGIASVLTQGTDYYLELDQSGLSKSGVVIRHNRQWCVTSGSIMVTYVAGLTSAELDDEYSFVKLALLEEIQRSVESNLAHRNNPGLPKKVNYHGDVSYEFTGSSLAQKGASGLTATAERALVSIRRIKL